MKVIWKAFFVKCVPARARLTYLERKCRFRFSGDLSLDYQCCETVTQMMLKFGLNCGEAAENP